MGMVRAAGAGWISGYMYLPQLRASFTSQTRLALFSNKMPWLRSIYDPAISPGII